MAVALFEDRSTPTTYIFELCPTFETDDCRCSVPQHPVFEYATASAPEEPGGKSKPRDRDTCFLEACRLVQDPTPAALQAKPAPASLLPRGHVHRELRE